MSLRASLLPSFVLVLALLATACAQPFGRVYEYEEEVYINLDGSATIIVNTSMAALAALHGADVPLDAEALIDRDAIRALYESAQTSVTRVSRPARISVTRMSPFGISTGPSGNSRSVVTTRGSTGSPPLMCA